MAIRSLVVERHAGSAIHPRAAFILQRSMEILRRAGIEDEVRDSSYAQFEPDGAIMSVETLVGKELAWHIPNLNEGVRDMSPSERLFVTQIGLEPVLRARAEELGAETRFNTELVECAQDADGVTSVIRDRASGETSTVRSRYLIGADGPRSPVREGLGIGMSGRGVFSKAITIYFRADVEPLLRERNLSVVMVMNDVFAGFFRIEKPYQSGFLVVHSTGDPTNPVTDVWDLDEQQLHRSRARGPGRRRHRCHRRGRDALAGDGRRCRSLPGGAHLPGGRRRARHAAVRRLRRKHRHSRRREPRVEACGRARRPGRS